MSTSSMPNIVGYVWLLTHVTVGSLSFDVEALHSSDPPSIRFSSDDRYGASDGINYVSGVFTLTESGFNAHFGYSTAVGYAGTDPKETAVIGGIGALVDQIPVTVSEASAPNTITMSAKNYELTFRRDDTATPDLPEPSLTGSPPPVVYGTPPNCDLSTAPGNLPCPGDSLGPS